MYVNDTKQNGNENKYKGNETKLKYKGIETANLPLIHILFPS